MSKALQAKLEELGLSPSEAGIYLILLRNRRAMGASAIAAEAEMARPSVYPAITRLIDLGLVESEATYGSGFTAVLPEQAMQSLIARKNDELLQCKQLATEVTGELKSIIGPRGVNEIPESKVIEVLRDPRVVGERFARLQLEAERTIDVFTKAPILNPKRGNPAENEAQKRGVRCRGIYERAILDDPSVKPYIHHWVAQGEQSRVYDGELPHKVAIFDSEIVAMPLIRPGEPMKTVILRQPQVAQAFTLVFEHFWVRSEPIDPAQPPPTPNEVTAQAQGSKPASRVAGRNGRQQLRRKKQPNP